MKQRCCIRMFPMGNIKGFEYQSIVIGVTEDKRNNTFICQIQYGAKISFAPVSVLHFRYIRELRRFSAVTSGVDFT